MQKQLKLFFVCAKIPKQYTNEELVMPNIKSKIKRVSLSREENAVNNSKKSRIKNSIKKFEAAVQENDFAKAEQLYRETEALLDQAAQDNLYHKNTVARKKSALAKHLDTIRK